MKVNLLNLFVSFSLIVVCNQLISAQINDTQLQVRQKVFYKNPQLIKISSEKFQLNKLKPIQFKSFTYHDFKLEKSALIKLKNGRSVSAEKFLNEANEIEKKLNEFGYSLRNQDEEIILGRFNYSYDHLQRQSSLLKESARYSVNENLRVTPCGCLLKKKFNRH